MVDKIKYYWMQPKEEAIATVAYAPSSYRLSPSLMVDISSAERLPFDMELHYVYVADKLVKGDASDECLDYLPNNFGCSILSTRLQRIIIDYLTGNESLQWLSVSIKGKTHEYEYHIPFFCKYLDTIDINKTVFSPVTNRIIINPAFDYEKIMQYAIFHGPDDVYWQLGRTLYVNERIRRAIESSRIPGLEFEAI